MDRFQLETSNLARYMAVHVWGDDLSAHTSEETDCAAIVTICNTTKGAEMHAALKAHAESDCATCAAIARAEELLCLEAEAPCTCRQSDADLFDARGCDFHDPNSPWNVRMRAV